MTQMSTGIDIKDLTFCYDKGDPVFDRLSLSVRKDEFVVVLGPSGCGKSTLLHLLAGHLRPKEGTLVVNQLANPPPGPDRFTVFQKHNLFFWQTALKNIALGPMLVGKKSKTQAHELSLALLKRVGLSGHEHKYPHQLSFGMQQRVGLARAFAIRPKVLLMDEPFASLDASMRMSMQQLLIDIWKDHTSTVIFVTHDIEEALDIADRILVLGGKPSKVLGDFHISEARPSRRSTEFSEERMKLHNHIFKLLSSFNGSNIA